MHAGYVSIAGTSINCRISASESFKSEHDFVHMIKSSIHTRPQFIVSSNRARNEGFSFFPREKEGWFVHFQAMQSPIQRLTELSTV